LRQYPRERSDADRDRIGAGDFAPDRSFDTINKCDFREVARWRRKHMSFELAIGEGANESGPTSLVKIKVDSPSVLSALKAAFDVIAKESDNQVKIEQARIALALRVIDEITTLLRRNDLTPEAQREAMDLIRAISELALAQGTSGWRPNGKVVAAIAASVAIAIIIGSGGAGSPAAVIAAKAALVAVA
jgi:hypothetical protein